MAGWGATLETMLVGELAPHSFHYTDGRLGRVLYHDKIFIIGGSNGITSLTSVEIFDPITNEWLTNLNSVPNVLNMPRVGLGVTVCCDKIYVTGGFDGRTFLKSTEIYDENTQQWHLTYNNINKSDKDI
ncbi:unnamed protein product [Adineta steineri]|uniref:Kelch repeat protein n=1 Tax=Adineta steineri TaxID=433720 RepID=A0A814C2P6_9BILA|nr:unnamed protein product [Adineta steineri]